MSIGFRWIKAYINGELRIVKNAGGNVRIPNIEVRIAAEGSDIAVVGFYTNDDPHGVCEVLATIAEHSALEPARALLQAAVKVLNSQDWYTLDVLDTRSLEDENNPPY